MKRIPATHEEPCCVGGSYQATSLTQACAAECWCCWRCTRSRSSSPTRELAHARHWQLWPACPSAHSVRMIVECPPAAGCSTRTNPVCREKNPTEERLLNNFCSAAICHRSLYRRGLLFAPDRFVAPVSGESTRMPKRFALRWRRAIDLPGRSNKSERRNARSALLWADDSWVKRKSILFAP